MPLVSRRFGRQVADTMDIPPSTLPPTSAQDLVERGKRELTKLDQRIAAAREQLNRMEQQRDRVRAFLNTAAGYMGDMSASAGPIMDKAPTLAETLILATEDEIRAHGRPMTIGELFARMIERGMRITGKNPKQNYSWILSNTGKGRVKHEFGQGWSIATDKSERPSDAEALRQTAAP